MQPHDEHDPGPQDGDIPHIGPNADDERERVRQQLTWPRDSVKLDPDTGTKRYTKPPLPTLSNLEIIIGQDPAIFPHLGYNEFTGWVTWKERQIRDEDETTINLLVQGLYGVGVSTERIREIAVYIAKQRPWHPVRSWLTRLVWDGTPRLERLLSTYAGAADDALTRAISRKWAVGCVARIMEPGCKVDTTLILVGKQGARKSSFFASLVPDPAWFSDTAMDLHSKDAYQQMAGVWIYEVAELSALRARDAESVKAFLTARVDRFRPPYGRNVVSQPRQVVFVGTTNEAEFLDDPTGARRFWPVQVGEIDIEAVEADRFQLWAEAAEYYQYGPDRTWWLTEEESASLTETHGRYERGDPWKDLLHAYLAERTQPVTVLDLMTGPMGMENRDCHKSAQMRVAGILAAAGWRKVRSQKGNVRRWEWAPPFGGAQPAQPLEPLF
jgi:putative DNA primase/helicase